MLDNPQVFISYSHDSEEHKAWVKTLATHLRSHGVDVTLDQWDLHIGQDLRIFMEHGISNSKKVLCICSEKYVEKANGGYGGTGYESMIISRDLLSNVNLEYIIPVVRNNSSNNKTPICLGTKLYIDFEKDEDYFSKYSELLKGIYEYDRMQKPPLGKNPFMNDVATEVMVNTEIQKSLYFSGEDSGTVEFDYDNNSHKYVIGTGEYQFVTEWSCASNDCIYAISDATDKIGYISEQTEFPSYEELTTFDYTSRTRTIYKDEIVIFKNHQNKFLAVKVLSVDSKSHGRKKNKMVFEYRVMREPV